MKPLSLYIVIVIMQCLISHLSFGQDRAGFDTLTLDYRAYNDNQACGSCAGNKYSFTFAYEDGKQEVVENCLYENMDESDKIVKVYSTDNKITKISWYAKRQTSTWRGCTDDHSYSGSADISYSTECFSYSDTNPWDGYVLQSPSKITISVKPALQLFLPEELLLPTDDYVELKATKDFAPATYKWQFKMPADVDWKDFPSQYIGKDSIRFSAKDLLQPSGIDAYQFVQTNIQIRIAYCSESTDLSTFRITKSPPHTNSVNSIPTSCFDAVDGHIKLFLDRALAPQELIRFSLFYADDGSFIDSYETETLAADSSYLLPVALSPGNYTIKYNAKTYTQSGDESWSNIITSGSISIVAPAQVTFTTQKTGVWCYGGDDGVIIITASGGVGNYKYMIRRQGEPDSLWYPFSSATVETINGLRKDTWEIQVKDSNGCYAKTAANASIVNMPVVISQPDAPLQINEVQRVNPTAFGYSNGYFIADITGGTANTDESYKYEFKSPDGTVISSGITTSVTASGYRVRIDGLSNGTYILSASDKNFSSATNSRGCTVATTIEITEPAPLTVAIEIVDSVRCKTDANGRLAAHALGGIPFAQPALPYEYSWKKKDAAGIYQLMPGYTDSIAANLATGWYAVNVTDANGISLTADSIFFLPEPEELTVSLSTTAVTCSGLPNGQVLSQIAGGTVPYSYFWNNGEETPSINNVPAGTYLLWVEDYHHCQAQQNAVVKQPNNIRLQVEKKDPTCNNGNNGFIRVSVTGGTAPFTYNWSGTNASTNNAENLKSGDYSVSIVDANGCNISHSETLINPSPVSVDLGPDRYICNGQQISYDVTKTESGYYSYKWSSNIGFTSDASNVNLVKAGIYYLTITDANNCQESDTLLVIAADGKVNNEFALPTHGYTGEKIVMANITSPAADSVQWSLPQSATIVSQSKQLVEMILPDTGSYYVSLRTFKGLCYADQVKKIIVSKQTALPDPGRTQDPFILNFSVAPIPNNGNFIVRVALQSASQVELKLINLLTSQVIVVSRQSGAAEYTIPINISLIAGTYMLLLETPKGRQTIKLLIL